MPFTSDVLLALRTINDLRSLKTHASEDTRVRACAAYFFLNFHQEEIARTYSVSQSTVSRWLKDCLDSDRVETRGRKKLFTDDEVSTLLEVVKTSPLIFLHEIQRTAHTYFGKSTSLPTLCRVLKRAGFSHKSATSILHKTKLQLILTFEQKLHVHVGFVLQEQLLFVDEISFRQEHFQRLFGWSPKSKPVLGTKRKFPERQLSLVVAIDANGYVTSFLQEGHFNRLGFVDFLSHLLSSGITSRFPARRSVIVLDGCNIHRSLDIYEAMKKRVLSILYYPRIRLSVTRLRHSLACYVDE
ncbi:hypothetical protein GEMRC1_003194 [Eukaryota sp. GEM-RC1]